MTRSSRALSALILVAAMAIDASAQRVDDRASELMGELESAPLPKLAPPAVSFVVRAEVSVTGPLEAGPFFEDLAVAVRAAGGVVRVPWSGESGLGEPVDGPAPVPAVEEPTIGLSKDGTTRALVLPSGQLVVETACKHCKDGWNRRFRLRLVGTSFAAPLVADTRVYFAARDNVVYSVRRHNGHRIWDHAADGRVVPSLVLWSGSPAGESETPGPVSLVLAVTDEPSALIALDARTGEPAATYEPGAERTIVGAPLVLPDGKLVLARQDYRSTDAALVVLESVWRPPAPSPTPTPAPSP